MGIPGDAQIIARAPQAVSGPLETASLVGRPGGQPSGPLKGPSLAGEKAQLKVQSLPQLNLNIGFHYVRNEQRLRYKAAEAQTVEHDKPRGHFLLPEPGFPPMEERPCFHTYFHFWNDGSRLRGPGTYYHTVASEKGENGSVVNFIDNWICAPLEVLAITATREDNEYGWLVEFTSRNGRQKRCAIPARWFAGRGDEALGELLALGLDITHGKQRALVLEYIATSRPEKRFAAALSTGWHDERTFVLPDEVIGKTAVWYHGKDEQNPYTKAGKFEHWRAQVAARAKDNPNLIVALCGALAGPLFHLFNVSGGGLHWFGPTTLGKTSMLEAAQSA